MQLNYGLLLKRSYPPLPPRLSELLGHFFVGVFFFGTFGTLFVSYFTKIRLKSAQKLLDLVHPPPLLVHKKCPKTFGLARIPPPLLEEVHN